MEVKQRLRGSLIKFGLVLLLGVAYVIIHRLTGWGIPCVFYLANGKLCPGCGISRMFLALLELDFVRALQCNALVMLLLPFGLVFGLRRWIIYVRTGNTDMDKAETCLVMIAFALTVAFWILRNLPEFSCLRP
jgi:hypothetical protein